MLKQDISYIGFMMNTLTELKTLLKKIHGEIKQIEPAEYTNLEAKQAILNGALAQVENALRNVINNIDGEE